MTDTAPPLSEQLGALTANKVGEYLAQAVREYGPSYVDPNADPEGNTTCNNVYRNEDGEVTGRCIAAQVLSYHGVPDEQLTLCDNQGDSAISSVIQSLDLKVGHLAKLMLTVAQAAQDGGAPWEAARKAAIAARFTAR